MKKIIDLNYTLSPSRLSMHNFSFSGRPKWVCIFHFWTTYPNTITITHHKSLCIYSQSSQLIYFNTTTTPNILLKHAEPNGACSGKTEEVYLTTLKIFVIMMNWEAYLYRRT